ncbi:GntR family transcriptional regulator [Kitasatospora sp. NBC_01302]|uniref:GntR family transcriptional regulator n=1 Tax=Kitasatospora sp. NBC_01302 TaxID=2903575 RepID=UPI002E11857C|nr:GntR family transcriptional regulator [Kitasatospora sp. NBC_01302]
MSDPDRPTFRVIADQIRAAIHEGTYAKGSTLPTDVQLAEQYGGNRNIVKRAIELLTAEGYVNKTSNQRGSTVSAIIAKIRRDSTARYARAFREGQQAGQPARGSFNAEIQALGMTPESRVRVTRVAPPANVAKILGLQHNTETTIVRARQMFADSTPVQLADSYIPVAIAEAAGLENEDTGVGGMLSRLTEAGYAQATIEETINVRTPSEEEAERLNLTEDHRVYEIVHVARTEDGTAIEVALHVMPVHLWELSYKWEADPRS